MAPSCCGLVVLRWSIAGLLLVGLVVPSSVRAQAQAADGAADRVDSLFSRWDKPNSPGCALGISQNGLVVYERGYGMASVEHGIAITPQSVFDAASVSKQFTAMAILLLAERGQLSLDDEARTYITEMPDYGTPVTIRHLLTHTSGLRDVFFVNDMAEPREWNFPDDFLTLLGRQEALNFPPGSEFQYLNFGYWLLGRIVERVSGQSLRTFTDANIFQPLGMTHTFRHDDPSVIAPNRATGYAPWEGSFRVARPNWLEDGRLGGNAGLHTTARDLLIWAHNFVEVSVGTPELLAAMHTKWYAPESDNGFYGLGVNVGQYRGLRTVWHDGSDRGVSAYVIRFPDHGLAIAILCNVRAVNPAPIANRVADIYLETSFPAPAAGGPSVAPPAEPVVVRQPELADLAGTYWNATTDRVLRFVMRDGHLMMDHEPLTPLGGGRFRLGERPNALLFSTPATGAGQEMRVLAPGATSAFVRMDVPRYSATDLQEFAGRYASTEVETTWTVAATESELVIRIRNRNDILLRPIFVDAFEAELHNGEVRWLVRFLRNPLGVITELAVTDAAIRRVRFGRVE